jgi:hypothetical protein
LDYFVSFGLFDVMNIKNQATITTLGYIVLVGLTVATYQIGETQHHSLEISLLVFAIAILKGAMISEQFMQLGFVKGIWRWPILIWLMLLSSAIYIAFTA